MHDLVEEGGVAPSNGRLALARLLAASPELGEVCRELVYEADLIDSYTGAPQTTWERLARKLVAKARVALEKMDG